MNRIKILRELKGISMKEAAAQLGLPYTTYVNYEKGVRKPGSETLIALADFYETSIDYLIGRPTKKTAAKSDGPTDEELEKLVRKAKTGNQKFVAMSYGGEGQKTFELTDEQYKAVETLLENLKDK